MVESSRAQESEGAEGLSHERVSALLSGFSEVRLLVVGDALLDEYLYGDAQRISPEAPVPVVHVEQESTVLGGAANVVRNIVALAGHCEFCCVVGEDAAGEQVIDQLRELGVDTAGVVRTPGRPTSRKTRVVAGRQQIVRVDREVAEPLSAASAEALLSKVEALLPAVDGVVLEDYGKGLLTLDVARRIMREAARHALPVSVDPKAELLPFRGAALIKPNLPEAEAISGLRASGVGGVEAVARELLKVVGDCDIAITRGRSGITIFDGTKPPAHVPTAAQDVFDVQGAGDTIIATLALARRAGASLWEASVIANAAASVVVGKTGTATADRTEVMQALPAVREAALAARARESDRAVEESS